MTMIQAPEAVVFLFDCDNTLLDNDSVQDELRAHLLDEFGPIACELYWKIFEELRDTLGYADYLGALQGYRLHAHNDPRLLQMSAFLLDYPFANRVYPGVAAALAKLRHFGPLVILSDGDVVLQPRKIQRSGLWDLVEGRVLIYIHKEEMLDDLRRRYPADHYVMVDDKLRVLTAMKAAMGERLTTVFPRQGHYALDTLSNTQYPAPDLTIEHVGDLINYDLPALLRASRSARENQETP